MSKKSSAAFVLFAVVSVAGILTEAVRKRSTAESETVPSQVTSPGTVVRDSKSDPFVRIGVNVMMFLALAGIIALAATPLIARATPASNENIRSHYGINVIDNPNFQGNTFLKMGDGDLAYVCDRPNYHALNNSEEIHCWTP